MNNNDRFEIKAHLFYKQTGFLAPGKSEPMGYGISYDVRLASWDIWLNMHNKDIDEVLTAVEYFMEDEESDDE